MKHRLIVLALAVSCSPSDELTASDLSRLAEYWGCCDSWVVGWSEDGTIVLTVDMPGVEVAGEHKELFGTAAVSGILRHGENFGDDVDTLDTGDVFHKISVVEERFDIVSGAAEIRRSLWESWDGEGEPNCQGHDVLDLVLVEPVFQRHDGARSIAVDRIEFPPLCVGFMPIRGEGPAPPPRAPYQSGSASQASREYWPSSAPLAPATAMSTS